MYPFSPVTLAVLSGAGWHVGRKVSQPKYRAFLSSEGYAWFPAVATFLEEFGDLTLSFKREDGSADTLNFEACEAAIVGPWWIQNDYARRIGEVQFCVIGRAYTNHLLLFMAESGRVYGGFDDYLCFIAPTGIEAIEVICTNQPVKEIP